MPGRRPSDPEEPFLRPTVASRVATIRDLMLTGDWAPARAAEFAAVWDVSESLVRHHAGEASRQIEAVADVKRGLSMAFGLLLEALDDAREEEKPGERARTKAGIAGTMAKMLGAGEHRDREGDPKTPPAGRVPFGMKPKESKPS